MAASNKELVAKHNSPQQQMIIQPEPTIQMAQQTPPSSAQAPHQPAKADSHGDSKRAVSQHDMDLSSMGGLSTSPPGSYSKIPPRSVDPSAVPPILPPHLLQVILNNPDKTNTTILPQPNHVMLNHLYALSIKDGIMVLSATHRFRKKYVTTLLYKPI